MKPFVVAGEQRSSETTLEVRSPFDGSLVEQVAVPADTDVEDAIARATETVRESRHLPVHARAEALAHVSRRLAELTGELTGLIVREGGKPWKWAASEAARAVQTFRIASEECRRFDGEFFRFDTEPSLGQRVGIVRRFAIGPVLGISPFNFPLNLVAHKVAPALAVGAPIVLKPSPRTPLSALALAELIGETDLPAGMISVLPTDAVPTQRMVEDERLPIVSFTGSDTVGWRLKASAPRKRFTLELGGNAGVIVHSDADLDHAAARIAIGGYYQAGQSCISVQRILVQAEVAGAFTERLVKHVGGLKVGDPNDPDVDVGPMIDAAALDRVDAWVHEAVDGGARVLCGGGRRDPHYLPTVLDGTTPEMKVRCEEVFGPVTVVVGYETFEDAIAEVNASRFGLHAGVFTRDITRAFQAHRDLEVGGVIVNDQSAWRADQMPYGGSKGSGIGREGLRYTMEDFTEPRIMVISDVPL